MSSNSLSKTKTVKIISKYFNEQTAGMDESLTDFQEPKKTIKGPKTTQKPKVVKPRKKTLRKLKGQKDIKTALNDIVEYTKDFNAICQKAGVDVDAEQLQLAIALSKSLQNNEDNKEVLHKPSTSSQRAGKIRSTLLEYGFKVPEVAIEHRTSRRIKKYAKNSKLLLMSYEEKQQKIVDKYSQIVLASLNNAPLTNDGDLNPEDDLNTLFNKTTCLKYDVLKDDVNFYINELIEVSSNTVGSLLKDWSEIPGRPNSPITVEAEPINVNDLQFSAIEIDILLSGRLIEAQNLVKDKVKLLETRLACNSEVKENIDLTSCEIETNGSIKECGKFIDIHKETIMLRSPSPDLFDEDESIENINNHLNLELETIQIEKASTSKDSDNKSRELDTRRSENCGIEYQVNNSKSPTCTITSTEATNNATKIDHQIDLTQHSDSDNESIIVNNMKNNDNNVVVLESSDDDNSLPMIELSGQKSGIDLTKSTNEMSPSNTLKDHDLTHNTIENISNCFDNSDKSRTSDNFNVFCYNHSSNSETSKHTVDLTEEGFKTNENCEDIDLTQSSGSSNIITETDEHNNFTNGEFKSDTSTTIIYDDIMPVNDNFINSQSSNNHSVVNNHSNSSDSEIKIYDNIEIQDIDVNVSQNKLELSQNAESEVFEISDEELNYSVHKSKFNLSQEELSQEIIETQNFDLGGLSVLDNMSKNDFSVNKTSGKISTHDLTKDMNNTANDMNNTANDMNNTANDMNNTANDMNNTANDMNNTANDMNNTANESYLPLVEIAGTKVKLKSPAKILNVQSKNIIEVQKTPKNSGYIVKTTEVTPVVDYGSLSTPERNQELDKYGLKPFKRKRAIQLLTHLYNQTHPVVEMPTEENSPLKKYKRDPTTSFKSPVKVVSEKSVSPVKLPSTQKQVSQKPPTKKKLPAAVSEKEINYDVTNNPVLNEVACSPEDWVFQKKEKAKVKSCRVPLHIAFYNYVTSRAGLRDAILRYEPINIDVVHRDLVGEGHRYDPKDLLRFLDKKCITVKTADNNTRNEKRTKHKS